MARKKTTNQTSAGEENSINIAKIGRSYYDIVDVYSQKIITAFIEENEKLKTGQLSTSDFRDIFIKKVNAETEMFKSWGWDTLSKNLSK